MNREYNILLVDDENLALMGIEQGIEWQAINVQNVYKANSMKQALECFEKNEIHLMISDIEMPMGNGLELIRVVRQKYPQVICIFYTCHAEFAYCQEAVRLGAFDYLLEPLPYDEMQALINHGLHAFSVAQSKKGYEDIWNDLKEETKTSSPIDKVKQIILENISIEMYREDLAKQVFMSQGYLSKQFKKETGLSLSEYIIEKRLQLAAQLLKQTDATIIEISQKSGFSYSSYFTKIFKKRYGVTPQQYRDSAKN